MERSFTKIERFGKDDISCDMYMASPTVPAAVGLRIVRIANELALNGTVVDLRVLVHYKNPDATA